MLCLGTGELSPPAIHGHPMPCTLLERGHGVSVDLIGKVVP